MALQELWADKYLPKTVDEYVFTNDELRQEVEKWIETGTIPNLILSGKPGVGKTALVNMLINELGIPEFDVKRINASRNNGIETLRNDVTSFVQTAPYGSFKIVFLDEADGLTLDFQKALRADMGEFGSDVRYILTCNYSNKLIEPLRDSRFDLIHITKQDRVSYTTRAATVLLTEKVEFDLDVLDDYVASSYPDLRKCLRLLQRYSVSGTLVKPSEQASDQALLVEASRLFKAKKVYEARTKLMQYLTFNPMRLENIYVWMYNNLNMWSSTTEGKDQAIIIIRDGLVNMATVGIPEICLSATLIELSNIQG